MRITFKQSGTESIVKVGPFVYGLDPEQLPDTLEVTKTMLLALDIVPKEQEKQFIKFADESIRIIKRLQDCITIEGDDDLHKPDTIVHMDIDPRTLMLTTSIESAPELNKDRVAKIDIMGIIAIYKDILELIDQDEPIKSNPEEEAIQRQFRESLDKLSGKRNSN